MKVTGNRNTQQTSRVQAEAKTDTKKSKKEEKQSAPQKSMSEAAEGLTRSMNSRLNRLMKPPVGDAAREAGLEVDKPDQQARVRDGAMPANTKPEATRALPGSENMAAGPSNQYEVDESLLGERGPAGGDLQSTGPGKFSDGRGADGDVGSMETGIGNPNGGFDRSAAGKLPPHVQGTIDAYKEKAFEAAKNGDFEGANRWAGRVSEELGKGPGTDGSQPPANDATGGVDPNAEGAAEEPSWVDTLVEKGKQGLKNMVTGRTVEGGKAPGHQMAEQADAEIDANSGRGDKGKGLGEEERIKQAEEAAAESGGTNVDTSTSITNASKPGKGGVTEDRTPESEQGPDVWREFTDEYKEHKRKADAGAEVNPGDKVEGATAQFSAVDAEAYTGNYGEGGPHTPTEEEIEAGVERAKEGGSIAPEAQ